MAAWVYDSLILMVDPSPCCIYTAATNRYPWPAFCCLNWKQLILYAYQSDVALVATSQRQTWLSFSLATHFDRKSQVLTGTIDCIKEVNISRYSFCKSFTTLSDPSFCKYIRDEAINIYPSQCHNFSFHVHRVSLYTSWCVVSNADENFHILFTKLFYICRSPVPKVKSITMKPS